MGQNFVTWNQFSGRRFLRKSWTGGRDGFRERRIVVVARDSDPGHNSAGVVLASLKRKGAAQPNVDAALFAHSWAYFFAESPPNGSGAGGRAVRASAAWVI